jgi:hypothetical protein
MTPFSTAFCLIPVYQVARARRIESSSLFPHDAARKFCHNVPGLHAIYKFISAMVHTVAVDRYPLGGIASAISNNPK